MLLSSSRWKNVNHLFPVTKKMLLAKSHLLNYLIFNLSGVVSVGWTEMRQILVMKVGKLEKENEKSRLSMLRFRAASSQARSGGHWLLREIRKTYFGFRPQLTSSQVAC
jgi:hypothetical protein